MVAPHEAKGPLFGRNGMLEGDLVLRMTEEMKEEARTTPIPTGGEGGGARGGARGGADGAAGRGEAEGVVGSGVLGDGRRVINPKVVAGRMPFELLCPVLCRSRRSPAPECSR